ncbi:electron transfer flavoprotein subunit alpha/FixB family protein [Peptoniphilus sp. GNH]|nr:electron transfer flavoprotein subunit alpha/FixB family protein [Peptoniphilus sp. GNH]
MENKNLWVLALSEKGKLLDVSAEIISMARSLGKEMKEEVVALVIANENTEELAKEALSYGADKVCLVKGEEYDHYKTLPFTNVLDTMIEKYAPLAVFIPATANGRDLGGRISARRSLGLVADCIDVKSAKDSKTIDWVRPTFDGKLISTIRISTLPQVGTIGLGVFKKRLIENPKTEIFEEQISYEGPASGYSIIEHVEKKIPREKDLSQAKKVIGMGMGLKDPENFKIGQALAKELGASVGFSKPIIDKGWEPSQMQVGVTGKKLKSKLYFALGISGARQHTAGLKDVDVIIAVNNDKDAAIFDVAHYNVVADLFEFVPKLTEKLKNM